MAVYPDPADVPLETRRRLLLEAVNRGVKASDLNISRSFLSQMKKGKRPVPDRIVGELLAILPDDAVLASDPAFFSHYIAYTRLEIPVDKLLQLLVDYIKRYPASAKTIISTLEKEAEKMGLTGKAYKITRSHIREFYAYLDSRVAAGDLQAPTASDYKRYIARAMDALDWVVTPHNIKSYLRKLQASHPGIANHTYKALRLFVKEVIGDRELLASIPHPKIRWKQHTAPSWREICRVADSLSYASPPRVLLLMLASTGVRVETMYNLKVEQVDAEKRIINLWIDHRTKRAYFSFVTPQLAKELKQYLEYRQTILEARGKPSDKLFPYKPKTLKVALYEAMNKTIGYKFHLKQLRKRFAEHLSHYLSTLELQVLMGHASREVVEKHYLLRDELENLQAKYDRAMGEVPCL